MSSGQRKGVVLILVGLALLLAALPFAEMDFEPGILPTMLDRIQRSRIRLVQGKGPEEEACIWLGGGMERHIESFFLESEIKERRELAGRRLSEAEVESAKQELAELRREHEACKERYRRDPRPVRTVDLPYRYIFAVGVITLLVGVGLVILGRPK